METVVNVGQLMYGQPTFHYYYSEGRFPSNWGDPTSSLFAQPSGSIWKNTSVQHLALQRERNQTVLKQDTCIRSNQPLLYTSPHVKSSKIDNCSVSGSCFTSSDTSLTSASIFLKSFSVCQHQTNGEGWLSDFHVSLGKCSKGFKCTYYHFFFIQGMFPEIRKCYFINLLNSCNTRTHTPKSKGSLEKKHI